MSRTTRVTQRIKAPKAKVYAALLDVKAVQTWMVPDGMTSKVHAFEAREGGSFRITLTYDEPTDSGKSSAQTDTFHGRFTKLVPNEEVVEKIEFEAKDPGMRGEMTVTMTLHEKNGATELRAVHEDLPKALSPADNETGWKMSLGKLAKLVEGSEGSSRDRS